MSQGPNSATGRSTFSSMKYSIKNAWRDDRRGLVKGVVAWLLFGAIIIVFVFLGMTPQQAGFSQGGAAAQVNGHIVSVAEFSEQVEQLGRNERFQQFQQFGPDFATRMIRQQAIQSLIDQRLLGENLSKVGFFTSDGHVRDAIADIQPFQENGKFSPTSYLRYLQATRQDAGAFEDKVRKQLTTGRATRTFAAAMRPISLEQEFISQVENKKVNVEAMTIPTEKLVIAETIPATDVKAFMEKSDAQGRIQSYYDTHKAEFSQPEQAKVRHILIRADKAKADEVTKAKAEADKIVAELKGGSDFAKLAAAKSADPGSKANGGLIDYFPRGAMVPEFEAYAFSGKVGEISEPIQTNFGFHVIKIEDRKAASEKKLEEVKEDIAEIVIAQEKSREEIATLEKALASGDTAAITNFGTKHRLNWTETGAFPVNADSLPKVGGGDQAVNMAFRLSSEKPYATELVRQGPQAILLRYKALPPEAKAAAKNEKQPTASPEARAERMASQRSEEAFEQWIGGLRKSAKITINPELGVSTAAADPE